MDLEPVVPPDLRWTDSKYAVVVGTEKVAQLDLTPLVTIREARAWSTLDRSKCSSPTTSTACSSIVEYLDQYSGGPHAAEAQSLLDAQGPTLLKLRDDEVWSKISPAACESAKAPSPEQIDSDCKPLKLYLTGFHDGQHATEAKQILEKATKRREALVKKLADQAERERKGEEQRERNAEQRERNRQIQQCQSACLMRCSNALNEGSCLAGCVQLCERQGGF